MIYSGKVFNIVPTVVPPPAWCSALVLAAIAIPMSWFERIRLVPVIGPESRGERQMNRTPLPRAVGFKPVLYRSRSDSDVL